MTKLELISRFRSIEKVKKGGQKTVYKAVTFDGKMVALKIIGNATDQRVQQEIIIEVVQIGSRQACQIINFTILKCFHSRIGIRNNLENQAFDFRRTAEVILIPF